MKKVIIIFCLVVVAMAAQAARVLPGIATVKQSDGTELQIKGHGDENFSYYTTTDGALLFLAADNNYYIAKVETDGTLSSTGILAHKAGLRTSLEAQAIGNQDKKLFNGQFANNYRKAAIKREPMGGTPEKCFPHTGSPKALVILVEFTDKKFSVASTTDSIYNIFEDYLNASKKTKLMGYNAGSVKQYYSDMSFGKYTPQFDLYRKFFSLSIKCTDCGQHGTGTLFSKIAPLLNVEEGLNISDYDADNDGYIDLLEVIYAGYGSNTTGNGNVLWPCSGYYPTSTTIKGKNIGRFGINNELGGISTSSYGLNGIGLFCHEFGHCIGLPDMYAPAGNGQMCINQAPEYYSLMDAGEYTNNGYRPTAMTAWERETLDWLTIEDLDEAHNVTLAPIDDVTAHPTEAKAYRIRPTEGSSEYYLVENLQKTSWNKNIFGHGLAVWHINYIASTFALGGRPNNVIGSPYYDLVPANGMMSPTNCIGSTIKSGLTGNATIDAINKPFYEKYKGQEFTSAMYQADHAGATYPGTSNVTSIGKQTLYGGGTFDLQITEIKEDTETGLVTFKFKGGGTPTGIEEVQEFKSSRVQEVYNLSGQKVSENYKGLIIRNGRKYIK